MCLSIIIIILFYFFLPRQFPRLPQWMLRLCLYDQHCFISSFNQQKSVYINGLLKGHTQIVDFILKRGLIGAQIPNGLCRVLLVVCQQISSINTHFFYLKSYVYFGWSWLCWYGSWIFNYLCYQCLSPLKFWIQISRCTRYKLLW